MTVKTDSMAPSFLCCVSRPLVPSSSFTPASFAPPPSPCFKTRTGTVTVTRNVCYWTLRAFLPHHHHHHAHLSPSPRSPPPPPSLLSQPTPPQLPHTPPPHHHHQAFHSRRSVSLNFCANPAVAMSERGSARRRRERQLRPWRRHVRTTVAMELATALHHTAQRVEGGSGGREVLRATATQASTPREAAGASCGGGRAAG